MEKGAVKLLNNRHPFCTTCVAIIDVFYIVKTTSFYSFNLAFNQEVAHVQDGTIQGFSCNVI